MYMKIFWLIPYSNATSHGHVKIHADAFLTKSRYCVSIRTGHDRYSIWYHSYQRLNELRQLWRSKYVMDSFGANNCGDSVHTAMLSRIIFTKAHCIIGSTEHWVAQYLVAFRHYSFTQCWWGGSSRENGTTQCLRDDFSSLYLDINLRVKPRSSVWCEIFCR